MNTLKILLILLTVSILFFSTCKKDSNEFRPVANFSTLKIEFGEVTFRNKSINATEYFWDFDDGNTSTEKDPIHEYQELGVYTVKLTASDGMNSDTYPLVVAIGQIFPSNLTQLDDLPFGDRVEMMNFTLNGVAYVGCGIKTNTFEFKKDLWKFNSNGDEWTLVDNSLDFVQASGVHFSIDEKVYTGLGNSNFSSNNEEFYVFSSTTESFSFDSQFPFMSSNYGSYILDAIGFSYDGKGYVIGSQQSGNISKTIWEYNPTNSSWTEKGTHPMQARAGMFHFQLGEKIIIGMGNVNVNSNFMNSEEVWEYNVIMETWTQKNNFPGTPRRDGISFTHDGIGYFGFGYGFNGTTNNFEGFSDLWKYDYSMDSWEKIADMPVPNNYELFGFVLGNSLYFGSGYNAGNQASSVFYEFEL